MGFRSILISGELIDDWLTGFPSKPDVTTNLPDGVRIVDCFMKDRRPEHRTMKLILQSDTWEPSEELDEDGFPAPLFDVVVHVDVPDLPGEDN